MDKAQDGSSIPQAEPQSCHTDTKVNKSRDCNEKPSFSLNRQIIALALPSLGSLLVEPVMTLADSAMVGHLGTAPLGGLTIGSTLLNLIVGVCIFLAYTTTALTARRLGAGDHAGALRYGIDGIWLAAGVGIALTAVTLLAAPLATSWMGGSGEVAVNAVTYLRTSSPGIIAMLIVLAATGTLRGLLNTKTPFIIAAVGALANLVLNATLIYGLQLGVAGSGLGTAIAQWGMALTFIVIIFRHARRYGVSFRPQGAGVLSAGRSGAPLVVRSICLQLAVVITVSAAAHYGPVVLASHQIVKSVWMFALFGMDAIAIAAQALIGQARGAEDLNYIHTVTRRTLMWGVGIGAVMLIFLGATSPFLPLAFTPVTTVQTTAMWGLLVAAFFQPLAGVVFVLDGILIGANDTRYLAIAMLVCLLAQAVGLGSLRFLPLSGAWALAGIWVVYGVFLMGGRALTLGLRLRGSAWLQQ